MKTIKKIFNSKIFDWALTILIALGVIYLIVINFVGWFSHVSGHSMEPTLKDNQTLLYRKSYGNIKRFDIVLLKLGDKLEQNENSYTSMHGENIVKRVIGLEGEKIKIDGEKLFVNGKEVIQNFDKATCEDYMHFDNNTEEKNICQQEYVVPKGYVYVLGDNRSGSTDSRFIGAIKKDWIWGLALDNKLK